MDKIRIAILGGGVAALATAFELTQTPELRARFDIDLYQIGWRLGGKCASSRNRAARGRNEEHGLHVLGGFYHNVFSQLRPLYAEWAEVSPATAIPFAQAFVGHDRFTLMQKEADDWRAVSVALPPNDRAPGVDPEWVTPAEMLNRVLAWLGQALRRLARGEAPDTWLEAVEDWEAPAGARHLAVLAARGDALRQGLSAVPHGPRGKAMNALRAHLDDVGSALRDLGEGAPPKGPDWLGAVELIAAIARGFVADRLDVRGFDGVNGLDAAAWLARHGASARAIACPLFQAGYHYAFAFEDGDSARPNIAAGVGMRGLLRMVFGYHGSVFMHMNGGMGEVVVAPYYEVLRARGVRFHFFSRVEALVPGDDGRLAQVRLRIQAAIAGGGDYEPLFDHAPGPGTRPRRSWPEAPLYAQLDDAETVRHAGDLEKWLDSAGFGAEAALQVDRDFDLCVLAMSMGVLRETTGALAQANPAWKAMLETAGVTPTIAAQIWRREPAASFHGVSHDGLMTSYEAPLDTWGDMSFLTALERADALGRRPASLSYLCGPITPAPDPDSRPTRPERQTEAWLQAYAAGVFPGLDDGRGGYRQDGEIERYVRVNDDPVDLYVCSPSGSIDARLRPDGSGFPNLLLAGDWTRNNFDCGAVETAVLSAKLCARAISGSPTFIYGESDFA